MAKNNNLTDFLTNTAEAIRTAEASAAAIDPQDFEAKIKALSSQDADAAAGHILSGKTAYVKSKKVTGTIPTKTSSNLTASGATVKVPAGYYAAEASKSVASGSATTPATTVSVTPTISVDSSGKITASGSATKSVTPTVSAGYVSSGTAGTITASASNTKQLDTQAGKTITPSTSEQTAVAAGKYTTGDVKVAAVPSGAISASGTASATTTVAPGTVTIANKTASVSGKTQIAASPTTATSGISTYYMAVDATAAANSTGTTSNISGTATAKVDTAGYVSSDATGSVTGTATAKTSAKSSSTYYIPVASGGCTVSGGGLSAGAGSVSASGTNITLTEASSQPSSGCYITVQGSGSVSRAAITDTHTAGYIPAKSATTVSAATSKSSNKATKYYTLPSGSYDASGGGLTAGAGSVSASSSNMSLTEVYSEPASGYYITAQGSGSVNRAAITKSATGGVVSTGSATVSSATSASSDTATKFYSVPTGSCSVSGGGLSGGSSVTPTVSISSGSDTNMSNVTVGSKDTTNYPYYFKVNGSSSSGSSTVSRAAIKDTHTAGYIPAKSATTVISSDSKTVSVNAGSGSSYVGLKGASLSAYGSATVSATVTPGELSVITQVRPVSGKTLVPVDVTTSSSNISTPFFAVVRPEVAAGSGTISGYGTASASVSSDGYAPTSLTGSGSVSVSGTATSSAKYGDSHYLSIPAGEVEMPYTPVTVTPSFTCSNGVITASNYKVASITPSVTTDGYVTSSQMVPGNAYVSGSNTYTDSNLVASNIKEGVSIFGVTGTLTSIESNWSSIDVKVGQYAYGCVTGMLGGTYSMSSDCAYYFPDTSSGIDGQFLLMGNRVGSCVLAVLALRTNGSWGVDCFTIHVTD